MTTEQDDWDRRLKEIPPKKAQPTRSPEIVCENSSAMADEDRRRPPNQRCSIVLRLLRNAADLYLPPDVREAATRWHLEQVLPELWRQAFIQGWRASQKAEADARRQAGT